jgi:hypothetical protein
MLRLALTSVFLLSIVARSQTATPIDIPGAKANCFLVEVKKDGASSAATTFSHLPRAPEPSGDSTDTRGSDMRNVSGMGVAVPIVAPSMESSSRTMDRQFILLNALSTVALVADVEATIHAVGGETKANEVNPVFGAHPTRARLYGITLPLNALSFYLSYHAKKTMPKRRIWEIGPGLSIAVHTGAAINNLVISDR